jgi:pimeloyl-ACP methyl ester carboxylesterase
MTSRRLDRPGGPIGYRREGDGPPLLLLHATLSSGRQLRGLAGRLAASHTVLAVDRRGHGESTAAAPEPLLPIDVAVHLDDLAAVLDDAGFERADVVGHSYGGCVGLELAARRPDRVGRVVAYEPPYLSVAPEGTLGAKADVGARTLQAAERDGAAAAALTFMAGVSGEAAVAALTDAARERIGRAGAGAIADATLAGMEPAGLADIVAPVLIATGTASEPIYGEVADALRQRIAGATVAVVDGADHLAPLTRPDALAALVEDFLSS